MVPRTGFGLAGKVAGRVVRVGTADFASGGKVDIDAAIGATRATKEMFNPV